MRHERSGASWTRTHARACLRILPAQLGDVGIEPWNCRSRQPPLARTAKKSRESALATPAVEEYDVSKRGEPKRVTGFVEQNGLTPIPLRRARLRRHRLQTPSRASRVRPSPAVPMRTAGSSQLDQGRKVTGRHRRLQITQDLLRVGAPSTAHRRILPSPRPLLVRRLCSCELPTSATPTAIHGGEKWAAGTAQSLCGRVPAGSATTTSACCAPRSPGCPARDARDRGKPIRGGAPCGASAFGRSGTPRSTVPKRPGMVGEWQCSA